LPPHLAQSTLWVTHTYSSTTFIGVSTPKLNPRYIGPFGITKVLSPVAYQLKLPTSMKCHNVFHISLLKPTNTETTLIDRDPQSPPPPVQVDNGEAYFVVERIRTHEPKTATSHAETKRYLIKREGYPLWEATKEPALNVAKDVPHLVQEYWKNRNPGSSSSNARPHQVGLASSTSHSQVCQEPPEEQPPSKPRERPSQYRRSSRQRRQPPR